MTNNLSTVTISKDAEPRRIADLVSEFGIAIIPGFLPAATVAGLNAEFDRFFDEARARNAKELIEREEGVTVPVVRKDIDKARFPHTSEIFGTDFMRKIAEHYLGTKEIGFNHQIYVNLNKGTNFPVTLLPFLPHFDKISTLKFFVYLTDTTADNGAMGAVLGSQKQNRLIRDEEHKREGRSKTIDNIIEEPPLVPVEGAAGTMFIFDTDMTHAAGFVRPGKVRRIMRGHTRTLAVLKEHGLQHQAA